MRVITGTARGRRLREPEGIAIRPTSDMVKEAMFNIIQFDIEGRLALDLFAGTGQLGIEALSRGVAGCTFVDSSPQAVRLIKANLEHCGLHGNVVLEDVSSYLGRCGKFDLIFCDPPYGNEICDAILQKINKFDILSVDGIIICENNHKIQLTELEAPYFKGREYRYGKTLLTVYGKRGS